MENLLCVILGFAKILTSFLSNSYKADTLSRSRRCPLYTGFTVNTSQKTVRFVEPGNFPKNQFSSIVPAKTTAFYTQIL